MSSPPDYDMIGKFLLYGGIAAGLIVALYYGIMQLIGGAGQAFLNAYQTALGNYVAKMDKYGHENNGVLTQAEQASKDFEEKQITGLVGNAASAFNSVGNWLYAFLLAGTLAGLAYGVFKNPDVVAKWKGVLSDPNMQPRSPKGQAIIIDCALVDELAAEGYSIEATNFLASLQSTWSAIDAPYMQQQVITLQDQINAGILAGVELELASYFVQAYTFELAMIPTVLALPLV